jgi:uncharacterized membrane protein HdeD (DUF308 family)
MTEIVTLPISCKTVHNICKFFKLFLDKAINILWVIVGCLSLLFFSITMGLLFYLGMHTEIAKVNAPCSLCPDANWIVALFLGIFSLVITIWIIFTACDVKFTCIKEKSE